MSETPDNDEQDLVRRLPPELVETFNTEKAKHRQVLKEIDRVYKESRRRLKGYYGPVREKRAAEAEETRETSLREEQERVRQYLDDLKRTIEGHAKNED